jgi:hypothetical protein
MSQVTDMQDLKIGISAGEMKQTVREQVYPLATINFG